MKLTPMLILPLFSSLLLAEPLAVGEKMPNANVRQADGETVNLSELTRNQNTVLVFYRGGWCPYCTTQLKELVHIEARLREAGWQIIALSPDSPAKLREALEESEFPYQLISDNEVNAAKAFGLAFTVDDKGFDLLKGFGIDLEAASGRDHRMLPVPGVFLVDETGTISFAHHDPDYKKRLSTEELLDAAGIE